MRVELSSFILLLSIFFGTVASGLFWTGFPVYYHQQFASNNSLPLIYLFATLGAMIFSFAGGFLSDLWDYRKISIFSNFVSSLYIFIIFLLVVQSNLNLTVLPMIMLPFIYFNFSLGQVSETTWLLKSDLGEVRDRFLNRSILIIVGKLSGFSLGPVLFLYLKDHALIVCVFLCLISSFLQFLVTQRSGHLAFSSDLSQKNNRSVSILNIIQLLKNPALFATSILTGVLSVPFNIFLVTHLTEIGRISDISLFWGCAGVSSLISLLILKKNTMSTQPITAFFVSLALCMASSLAILSVSPWVVIASASVYVLFSTYFSMQFQVQTLVNSEEEVLGSSSGVLYGLVDAGIFLGMCLSMFDAMSHKLVFLSFMTLLIFLRCFSFVSFIRVNPR